MIDLLSVKNFKCLDDVHLKLAGITVLAGLNGMGKSTCIQALLALHQSLHASGDILKLVRNGPFVELGTPKDVLWEGADAEEIEIGIESSGEQWRWRFKLDADGGEFGRKCDGVAQPLPENVGLFTDYFEYLRAERWGPRTSFPMSSDSRQKLGRDGEYAVQYLAKYGENKVFNKASLHPDARSEQLLHQVEAWLGEISPGTRIYTESHSDMDLVNLSYAFGGGSGETNHYRSTNVGFGISYTLPIIVLALTTSPGSLVLIENPEAHLHPRGQRKMGELLGVASLNHIQIIAETHSDHFLNGLRLAVHSGKMKPENIAMHYFQREQTETAIRSTVTSPQMDEAGRIDNWPDGFFDETDKALRELLLPPKKQ